jgi:hypothetical protein
VIYPNEPAHRTGRRHHRPSGKALAAAGLVVAGALLLGCGAAGAGHHSTASSPAATPSGIQLTGSASAAPATAAAPKQLLKVSGDGAKNTATFATGAEWTLTYTYDCSDFGYSGNFIVSEYGADGSPTSVLVNTTGTKGSDTVPVHADSGTHYLELNSECTWTVAAAG